VGDRRERADGAGGSFLTEPLTLKLIRSSERYISSLVNMEEERGLSMVERAYQRAREIPATHRSPVPETVVEGLRRYMERRLEQWLESDL